jgi:hypothetical protein
MCFDFRVDYLFQAENYFKDKMKKKHSAVASSSAIYFLSLSLSLSLFNLNQV